MKTLLITGARGFIGSSLKNYFKDKFHILAPTHQELDVVNKNAVKEFFARNPIDIIIHCATNGATKYRAEPQETLKDNLAMMENILTYKLPLSKVITFGSGAMYDKSRPLHKISEDCIGEVKPKDLYGLSKMMIAQSIKQRSDVVCLNIFGCYGYNEISTRFPTYAITKAIENQDIAINQNVIFDYLFIEDLNRIVEYFLEYQPKENVLNATPTVSVSLDEIAKFAQKLINPKVKIRFVNSGMNNEYTGSNSKLLKEIPNFKFTPMKTGLEKLYRFILKNQFNIEK